MMRADSKRNSRAQPTIIGAPEHAILTCLYRYEHLTAAQICRLLYSPTSQTYVRTLLKRLADSNFIQPLFLPRPSRNGSAPIVHALARKARNYLHSQGFDVEHRYRPSEEQHGYLFLSHALSVRDFLISLDLLCRQPERIQLKQLINERELKRSPIKVENSSNGQTDRILVIPDAWFDLWVTPKDGKPEQMCIALETDQGTIEQNKFRRKIRGYIESTKGAYQDRFNTTSLTVVFAATPGEKRRNEIFHWTEMELEAQNAVHLANLFLFTGASPATTDPNEFFVAGHHWYQPFKPDPVPLIEGLA